jgi:type II secretory pathway component PulF
MPVDQLAIGLRVLADFLESGLPLARALASLEELAPPAWRAVLPAVREGVRQGKPLTTALTLGTRRFPPLVLGIVRAGEAGSGLAASVRRAAELVEESAATRSAIRGALAYPIVLATAGSVAVALLVGVVLPRFAAILADLGQSLPASTQLVLHAASFAQRWLLPAAFGVVVGAVAWRAWLAAESGVRAWHELLLHLPLLGAIRRSSATSRGCAAFAALLDNGVPMSLALKHAAAATGDACLEARLLDARAMVVRGERLSRALSEQAAATPTAMRLVRAGEESGRLASMLAHAARLEREHALQRTRAIVRLLEPSLVVLFGGVVAVVAAALLQALYSARPPV